MTGYPPAAPGAKSRGFTLVSAIFILVVLAGLGAAILVISTAQQVGSALDIQGSRVYEAARAGIQWGAYKQLRPPSSCAASTSFAFPTAPTLAGITVTVTCTTHADGSGGPPVHVIQSTACNQPAGAAPGSCPNPAPGANYIERRLKVTL
ncbi:MAG: agglutinin biogenesis protein MshP [Betaproteobacteria bacterium]|nr:agglutinin biogenesis protein MshP [Betaproteobacteria bacterium]